MVSIVTSSFAVVLKQQLAHGTHPSGQVTQQQRLSPARAVRSRPPSDEILPVRPIA